MKNKILNKYIKVRSSIYGQVVYAISILSIFLFISFGIIFRFVNEDNMQTVIKHYGDQVVSIIEGSLYQSMLKDNKEELQKTLTVINSLPGICDVSMYDNKDNLVYVSSSSSPSRDSSIHYKSDCKACHIDIESMFNKSNQAYRVVSVDSDCDMNQKNHTHRHLFVKSSILNEKSCFESTACHVHKKSDEVLGSLIVKIPLSDLDKAVEESSNDFFLLATITTILLIVFLFFFTRKRIKNPLNDIIKASKAVANGDTKIRLDVKRAQLEDLKMVSLAFNNMLDNLDTATYELKNWSLQLEYKVLKKSEELKEVHNELIHVERMASLGKLSSSVAHEINNPLAGVLTYTKLANKQLGKDDFNVSKKKSIINYLQIIESETKRCGEIVKGLLDFSKKDQKDFEPKSLHIILNETYNLMLHSMKIADINFSTEFTAKSDMIRCCQNQIKQACIAILVNSSEAILANGEIMIRTRNPDIYHITFEVIDNGSGIDSEDIPHIFEPFFSRKENVNGTGLGLAVVHGIVQSHNGKTEVISTPGFGTTISITLPLISN